MEFRLLGPLEVVDDTGQVVEVQAPRWRAVLAMLLLRAGQVVSTQELIRGLWGGQPPKAARESVQYFVHRLRKALPHPSGERVGELLETVGSGYRLRVPPAAVDAVQFRELLDAGRSLRAGGDAVGALERFERALGLWRGPALAEFSGLAFAEEAAARLESARLACVEARLGVGLELGRHAELVGELEALVAEQPLRESARALLMVGLYRSGRQAEALETYRDARRVLVARVGAEPGEELRRLERAILTHDPALDLPEAAATAVTAVTAPAATAAADPGQGGGMAPAAERARAADAQPGRAPLEERKLVTVVIIGLRPQGDRQAPEDPEDVRAQVDAAQAQLAALVARYGGLVVAAATGRLLVVFGAQRSRADDPERAVRAALEGGTTLRAAGFVEAAAGVATGEVLVTGAEDSLAGGDTTRPEDRPGLVVVGEVVHAATALEALAPPGGVAVGAATWRATRRVITYRPVQPATPLEQATGVQAWQAVSPLARTGAGWEEQAAPLVERKREVELLADLLDRFLREQEPHLLTLISDPGLGKTRLVGELARMVDAAPELISWRVGYAQPFGEGAFAPLAAIVKDHAGILDTDPREVAQAKLAQAVGTSDQTAVVVDQLRALLGAQAGAPPTTDARATVEAWQHFLHLAAAERPMVVVVEDLQWADDALLEVVDELVDHVGTVPLLVVATARPELLDRRPGWGGGKRNSATQSLEPLSPAGVATLLEALLGDQPLTEATRQALIAASGGNPLYVEEYVEMLRERQVTLPAEGGALPVPETVQQLIAARIDSLPVADKRLLQDAAVIGAVGWVGALAAVAGCDRGQAQAGLARLAARRLLRQVRATSVAGELEYTFRHALIRDGAYTQIVRAARADKHQRAAAWLQARNPDRAEALVELVAYHYSQALALTQAGGQPTAELAHQTRHMLRAAGDHAGAQGALARAADYYQRALALWPPGDSDRAELLFRLGEARAYGEHAGEDVLIQARDALTAAGRLDRAQEADVLLALAARSRNDGAQAAQHLEQALARPTGPSPARALALAARAVDLMIGDRHQAAVTAGQEALRMSQTLDAVYAQALAFEAIGSARLKRGDPAGRTDLEACIRLLEQQRNPAVHYCRFDLAWGLWWLGDLTGCAAATTAGRQAAEQVGDAAVRWFAAVQAGLDYAAGRWEAVLAAAERLFGGDRGPQDGYLEPWYQILRARIHLARGGDLDGALTDARAALQAATTGQDTRYRQVAMALLGRVLLATGDRQQALAMFAELTGEQRADPERACVTPDLAVLLVDLDQDADGLPEGLAPTRWHAAVRAYAARDFAAAADLYGQVGSVTDQQQAQQRAAQ